MWNQNQTILIHFLEPQPKVVHKSKEMPNTGLHVDKYMDEKGTTNKTRGCVTPWPCDLHYKVPYSKRKLMEIQIFHHAKM